MLVIYTDGGCRGNPGYGAWAAVITDGKKTREIGGSVSKTTNNIMEITAAIEALSLIKKPSKIILYSDSTYLIKGVTQWCKNWLKRGWVKADKKPVLNVEYWKRLLEVSAPHDIDWKWVKGHSGNEGNERCDSLLNEIMNKHTKEGEITHNKLI